MQLGARNQEISLTHSKAILDAGDQWTKSHALLDLLLTDKNW